MIYSVLIIKIIKNHIYSLLKEKQSNENAVTLTNNQVYFACNNPSDDSPPAYQEPTIKINKPITITRDKTYKDYVLFSIFNLLCCFCWFGIPALIFSVKAREQFKTGRLSEAKNNAKIARKLNFAGFIIGTLIFILTIWFEVYSKKNVSEAHKNIYKLFNVSI